MKRLIAIALASLSIPSLAAAQAAYVSMSFWNVPADPAALIQNPALVAQFQSVIDAGADQIHSARLSESGVANITLYEMNDALDAVLEQTAALRDGAANNPGFEMLEVLQGVALTQIDATPATSRLGYLSGGLGNVSSSDGGCILLSGSSSDNGCPGAEGQSEHVSISVWNVPADPAALAQDPALAGQLQAFVDLGASRLYPVRLSESSIAILTFYPVNDALEDVLAQSRAARAATAEATPGFELLDVYEAPVLFVAQ